MMSINRILIVSRKGVLIPILKDKLIYDDGASLKGKGISFSQIAGIFYPTRIDNFITKVRGFRYYGRYMDDSYAIDKSKERLTSLLSEVKKQASDLGIFINDSKIQIKKLDENFVFLQNRYKLLSNGRLIIRINPKRVTKMRRKLKDLREVTDRPGSTITFDNVLQLYKSWMGNYRPILSKVQYSNMKESFISLYSKELKEYNINEDTL